MVATETHGCSHIWSRDEKGSIGLQWNATKGKWKEGWQITQTVPYKEKKAATTLALGAWICYCHKSEPSIKLKLKRRM